MNVQQAIHKFLRHGQSIRKLSDRTLRAYESDLEQFHTFVKNDTMAGEITPSDLEQYVEKLGTGTYRGTSIRRKVAALKVFFRYLEESGVVDESPARKLRIKQPVESRVPNVLTPKEIKALLQAPKKQIVHLAGRKDDSVGAQNRYFCAVRDNLIIELLFSTGIRIGELVALDVADANVDVKRLTITGRATRGRAIVVTSVQLLEALRHYLEIRSERPLDTEALFVGRSGTRLTIYSIENIFKKYVKNADIRRHVTPHALRHTMASMLINNGTDIKAVQEVLGHASILSTQVYTRMAKPRGRRAAIEFNPRERIAVDSGSARLSIRRKG
jgi:integrase/recombinase XerD